jgi:hypothetical protein
LFGKDGGLKLAGEFDSPLLGQIPLVMEAGEAAEKGLSIYGQKNKQIISAFDNIVRTLLPDEK